MQPLDARPTPAEQALIDHPHANQHITLAGLPVAYRLERSKRRSIGMIVGPQGLTVRAPSRTSLPHIHAALTDKTAWIVGKLIDARQRRSEAENNRIRWQHGAQLPFLGGVLQLQLDPHQRRGATTGVPPANDTGPALLLLGLPASATEAEVAAASQKWLKRQARAWFAQRLEVFAPQMGVRCTRLTLSSARTRWGSASHDSSIRLNWRLIHVAPDLIDYVVVHELAHLHEMNHSPRFWQHVAAVLPDWRDRRQALKAVQMVLS